MAWLQPLLLQKPHPLLLRRTRYGPGFSFQPPNEDFLDTLDEPPRVSVRRRMIRTIATVAQANYDCWYLVAHSQGTIAAFNGLMEAPFAWPGYFDETTWRAFCAAGFGGPGNVPDIAADTMPRRPVWAMPDEVAYRSCIFAKFRGLLTLGSPLEKFAAIWPARVPISRIPAFRENTVWINVFDPLDPVSGVLKAYDGHPTSVCPKPKNIGYAAYPVLLLAHLRYVTKAGKDFLADGVAKWLLTGKIQDILIGPGRFEADDARFWRRTVVAWLWWLAAFAVLGLTSGWTIRMICAPPATAGFLWHWLWQYGSFCYALGVVGFAIIGTLVAGGLSRWQLFQGDKDPPAPPATGDPISDPDPGRPALPPWPAA
jgi:hypothetical protein